MLTILTYLIIIAIPSIGLSAQSSIKHCGPVMIATAKAYPFFRAAERKLEHAPEILTQLKGFRSPSLVGFHGTNLEAVKQLLRTGYLPAGQVYFKHLAAVGHNKPALYMAQISSRVPKKLTVALPKSHPMHGPWDTSGFARYHDFQLHQMSLKSAWDSALIYSKILTGDSNFLKSVGLEFSDENRSLLAKIEFDYEREPSLDHPWPLDLQQKYIDDLDKNESQKLGIILGIHKSVFKDLHVLFDGDEGLRIELPSEGLALKYVYSIIPIGREERVFFK